MILVKPSFYTGLNYSHHLARGLLVSYLFNEGNGTNVNDLTGNRRNGILTNSPLWEPGGIEFNADYEHVNSINGAILQSSGTIAFSYRHNGSPPANWYYWFVLDDDYDELSFLAAGNYLYFEINGIQANWSSGWNTILDKGWHIIAVTWNDAADYRAIYIDGVLAVSNSDAFTWDASGAGDHNLRIGGRPGSTGRYAAGVIGFFHAWDHDFSADKVKALLLDPYGMFRSIPFLFLYSAAGNITGIHTAYSLAITKGTHTGCVDRVFAHTALSLAVTKGTHSGYVDVVAGHTASSLQVTKGTHSFRIDVAGSHTVFSLSLTAGTHTGAVDRIFSHTVHALNSTPGTHSFYVDIVYPHTAASLALTKGTHSGTVDVYGIHTTFALNLTSGTHTGEVGENVVGTHTSTSLQVTNGTHTGVVNIIGQHTAYSLAVTKGAHTFAIDITGGHSSLELSVQAGTHTRSVSISGKHDAASLSMTKGSHTGVVDVVAFHTAMQLIVTPGSHTGMVFQPYEEFAETFQGVSALTTLLAATSAVTTVLAAESAVTKLYTGRSVIDE